ncbi:MFS transporter [Cellulomonas humilata]|uniref:MFS family arabinose efflux permease n=1 Tax=Cellulomonas humilata TaxID=144055 RepID=A0ABU0E923_9CELL|nr:MFS transporter [Cellulomonas humilata]MDQ0371763.1 putative MFS family arabinose efflux permease [Cellulomonas humilata]
MTTTPALTRTRLPWPSLAVLGGATFVMVTGEMLPTAVLPQMSADLGVTQARTGLLVSLWALTVVVATFPLVRLTRRWDRRSVVAGALVVFAAASALTAVAPTYEAAVASRLLGAAVCGLLWATVNAHVADIVPSRHLATGVAVVLGGATLGTVIGVPLASFVAHGWDWRVAFGSLAVLGGVAAALARAVVTRAVVTGSADERAAAPVGQLRPVLVVAGLVGLVLVGHFAAFTFVTRLVADASAGLPGGVSGALLVFGASSALGLALVGRVRDGWTAPVLVTTTFLVAVSLLALVVVDGRPAVGIVVLVAWGLTSGTLPPLAQTLIMRIAGPEHRGTAGGVIPVVFNLGIAVGAAVGSLVVERSAPAALPVPAALVVAVAAVGLVLATRSSAAPDAPPVAARALVEPATPAPCPS